MTAVTKTLRIATPAASAWDDFVQAQTGAHILQMSAWGAFKAAYGWQAERVAVTHGEKIIAGAQLLFRPLPLRLGTMAYLPMGPFIADSAAAPALWQAIHQSARRHQARFLKWEPGIIDASAAPDFAGLGFRPSPQTIQPPRTILIDIQGDDESILARMNQGTRRKVRQGQKHGIRYYEGRPDDVTRFNSIMQATGSRQDFGVHAPDYYETAHRLFVPQQAALILAEHDGDTLAGVMVFAAGRSAWYFYGASSSVKRNLMASYGVQWAAIQWARSRGCTVYDMWGVPDCDETELEADFQQRSDGLWGVYGFKRGWGGQVTRAAGAWDYVYSPLLHHAYRLALRLR